MAKPRVITLTRLFETSRTTTVNDYLLDLFPLLTRYRNFNLDRFKRGEGRPGQVWKVSIHPGLIP